MNIDYKLIGNRIKLRRKEKQLTQEQLAEKIDVTVGYISQIERGITRVNLDTLATICGHLDCDIAFIISGGMIQRDTYLQNELIQKFTQLSAKQKQIMIEILDVLLKN